MISLPKISVAGVDVQPTNMKLDLVSRRIEVTPEKELDTNSTVIFELEKRITRVYPPIVTVSKITKDLIWYKPVETTTDGATTTTGTETTTGTTVISEEL